MNELDGILAEFQRLPDAERYDFIARLKRYLSKRPDLKADRGHALFIALIGFHIAELTRERDQVQAMLTSLADLELDGYASQPYRYSEGSKYLQSKMKDRIEELNEFIGEYQDELTKRKEMNNE